MLTRVAHLRGIAGINHNNRYTQHLRFIFYFTAQIIKCPFIVQAFLLFRELIKAFSNAFQLLYYYSLALLFGKCNNLFSDDMIDNRLCSFLFSRKTFQDFFTAFRSFRLQRRTDFLTLDLIIELL